MRYEPIDADLLTDSEALSSDCPPAELLRTVIAIGLHAAAVGPAQAACLRLSSHQDDNVRGNALLALGHLARRFGSLDQAARGAVEAGLADPSGYVRGQADSAADDLEHFLGWRIERSGGAD
jgi:hypothetical protein